MDEADKAQDEVDQQLQISITNRQAEEEARRLKPPVTECIDCGEEIPIARQLAVPGCRRCVICKESFELQQRRTKK